jgi:hypothetical protein
LEQNNFAVVVKREREIDREQNSQLSMMVINVLPLVLTFLLVVNCDAVDVGHAENHKDDVVVDDKDHRNMQNSYGNSYYYEPITAMPTPQPTHRPSPYPTPRPTPIPTAKPSPMPTHKPSPRPSPRPTDKPTPMPRYV